MVTSRCSNACVFCAQAGLALDEPGDLRSALRALARAHDEVTLTGGEPTLRDDLGEVARAARGEGFARVGVQTHGRRLREPGYAASLARAGVTDVHLSLHGASPAVHDYHTGVAGSFVESAAGMAAARAAGLTVAVSTVLTRSNFRSLAELPGWLSARGAAAWAAAVPRAAGGALEGFDRVVPRLAMALPFALHALAAAKGASLTAWVRGAPLCLLGPYAARALDDDPRAYGPVCEACPARARCPGVDARYLKRFAGDELSASRAPRETPSFTARERELARMFTGPGPLATAPARVSLPVARG